MKTLLLAFLLCLCSLELLMAQGNDGVVSFDLPVRNSLMFNRYLLNPTFSFVREQNTFISIYNKREWVQFDDAPLTYLAGYSGRFSENIGAGVSLFQQNYGVLTTFGGVLNFAYNAQLDRDSNLTFGLNIGAYSSGINTANVVTNFADPSLQNVPSNFLVSINPGVNYGTDFFDFGLAVNNLVLYNVQTSEILQDDENQGLQAHVMYTGYMSSRGFFDDSKFSGLVRSEFTKNETIISANAMLSVPKGIWFQAGYNTRFGASGGLGINITKEIAIEYNYETAFGNLMEFGASHEITLAYRLKNKKYFDYSRQDEVSGLISTTKKYRPIAKKTKVENKTINSVTSKVNTIAEAERQTKRLEEQKAIELAEQAKRDANQKAESERQAKRLEEQRAKELAEQQVIAEQAKRDADQKIEAERQAKRLEEQRAKELAEQQVIAEQAKRDADQKAEAERQAQILEEEKAKELEGYKNELITNPKDEISKAMQDLLIITEESKTKQADLIAKYDAAVTSKDETLKNLRKENDLSEQGITIKPQPFKSITAENNALQAIKTELDDVIKLQSEKITELKEVYESAIEADTIVNEIVMLFYKKEIARLTSEQIKASETKINLESQLERIKVETEFERRRRIKRAEFDNEEERYRQDRAALDNIKKFTTVNTNTSLTSNDFDFGIEQSANIQILKNVNAIENGYYLTLAVHNNIEKRNDFVTKSIESGLNEVDFFYDVNTSQYYIYAQKFENIEQANKALESKGTKPYNIKMSIIKIEN